MLNPKKYMSILVAGFLILSLIAAVFAAGGEASYDERIIPGLDSEELIDTELPTPDPTAGSSTPAPTSIPGSDKNMIELGNLGYNYSEAMSVNDKSQVVGYSYINSSARHAFYWEKGKMIDLGTLGGENSIAVCINNKGQIVGKSDTKEPGISHAFISDKCGMKDLGTLGGTWSEAISINNRGQAAGNSLTEKGSVHAFIWEKGKMIDLGTLGGERSNAYSINDKGQVVGVSETGDGKAHAFLWEKGRMKNLGNLAGEFSVPYQINNRGEIAGYYNEGGKIQAFYWKNGKSLKIADGYRKVMAYSINNRGQVIGCYYTGGGRYTAAHPFLWENGKLKMIEGRHVNSINNKGQIAGSQNKYKPMACLWLNAD